jgi:hypothetical protein
MVSYFGRCHADERFHLIEQFEMRRRRPVSIKSSRADSPVRCSILVVLVPEDGEKDSPWKVSVFKFLDTAVSPRGFLLNSVAAKTSRRDVGQFAAWHHRNLPVSYPSSRTSNFKANSEWLLTFTPPPQCYVAYWLRHCATSRKVPGSIPASVTGFFSDVSFWPFHGPGVDSAPIENEYQGHSWG